MNKSAPTLTSSSSKSAQPVFIAGINTFPVRVLFLTIVLVASLLPWVILKGSSLTLGIYDLAEWSSLHPLVRASSPPLLTNLLLRMAIPLSIIVLAASTTASITQQRLKVFLIVLLAISIMPPLEFFRQASGDPNLRQQFGLATGTLLLAGSIALFVNTRHYVAISITAALLAAICGLWGWSQAYQLMGDFQLNPGIGWGVLLFLVVYVIFLVISIYKLVNKIR